MIEVITGLPPCPMCDCQLGYRPMPGFMETYWYCNTCGTQWETPDLIQALNDNEELASEV